MKRFSILFSVLVIAGGMTFPSLAQASDEAALRQVLETFRQENGKAFKKQKEKDRLVLLTANSTLPESFVAITGAPVLAAVAVRRWDQVGKSNSRRQGNPAVRNVIRFTVVEGQGGLLHPSADPLREQGSAASSLTMTVDAKGIGSVWYLPVPDSKKAVIEAQLLKEGWRGEWVDSKPMRFAIRHQGTSSAAQDDREFKRAYLSNFEKLKAFKKKRVKPDKAASASGTMEPGTKAAGSDSASSLTQVAGDLLTHSNKGGDAAYMSRINQGLMFNVYDRRWPEAGPASTYLVLDTQSNFMGTEIVRSEVAELEGARVFKKEQMSENRTPWLGPERQVAMHMEMDENGIYRMKH